MLRARCDSCRSRRRPSRVCRVAPWGDSPRCPRAVLGCPPAEPVLDPMRTCSRLRSAALPLGATVRGALERSSGAPPPSRCSTRCEPRAVERDTKGRAPSRNGGAEQDRARLAARAVVRTAEKRRDEAARASTVPARSGELEREAAGSPLRAAGVATPRSAEPPRIPRRRLRSESDPLSRTAKGGWNQRARAERREGGPFSRHATRAMHVHQRVAGRPLLQLHPGSGASPGPEPSSQASTRKLQGETCPRKRGPSLQADLAVALPGFRRNA